jgi:peptide/nickel transport system permease protein
MKWYIVRRLLWTVFATWFAVSVTFLLMAASPQAGELTAAQQAALSGGDPQEAVEDYRQRRGLDRPLAERYVTFLVGIVTLNWGWSVTRSQAVLTAVGNAWQYSFQYTLPTLVITTVVGYGLGLYAAFRRNQPADYASAIISFFGISIPNFWFAIVLILVAGVWFGDATVLGVSLAPLKLPTFYDAGVVAEHGFVSVANARQLILPITVLATGSLATQMRYSRAQALEYVTADFVKTARAKGASDLYVLFRHVFRVALVPLTNILVGTVLGVFIGGSLIIETVFQIPGLGLLAYNAVINNDVPLFLGPFLIGTFLVIVGNLIEDVLYTVLDPRIDYGDR